MRPIRLANVFRIAFVCHLGVVFHLLPNGCQSWSRPIVDRQQKLDWDALIKQADRRASVDFTAVALLLSQKALEDQQSFVQESSKLLSLPTVAFIQCQRQHQNQMNILMSMYSEKRSDTVSLLDESLLNIVKILDQNSKLASQIVLDFNRMRLQRFSADYVEQERLQSTDKLFGPHLEALSSECL